MKRSEIDWTGVHTENKWTILRDQWRFGLWAFFTSIGSVMFGFDLGVGQQILAMVGPSLDPHMNSSECTILKLAY
jgi:hypothetical protein